MGQRRGRANTLIQSRPLLRTARPVGPCHTPRRCLSTRLSLPMCVGTAVIAGGPGGAARARTGRNGAIPHDRPVHAFDGIVQNLVLFYPVKAHIMMPGESSPAGV